MVTNSTNSAPAAAGFQLHRPTDRREAQGARGRVANEASGARSAAGCASGADTSSSRPEPLPHPAACSRPPPPIQPWLETPPPPAPAPQCRRHNRRRLRRMLRPRLPETAAGAPPQETASGPEFQDLVFPKGAAPEDIRKAQDALRESMPGMTEQPSRPVLW